MPSDQTSTNQTAEALPLNRETALPEQPTRRAAGLHWLWARWPGRRLLTLLVLVGALWVLHPFWLPPIGGYLLVSDPLQPADAVMPLAGDTARLRHAASLTDQHYARWFVLSNTFNENSPTLTSRYRRNLAVEQGVRNSQILITSKRVTSTYEEALALRAVAQSRQWERVIVVTDPYHTRRTQFIFRDVFADTGISIVVRPVAEHWYTADSWWQTEEGRQTTALEYLKFVSYIVGYRSTA